VFLPARNVGHMGVSLQAKWLQKWLHFAIMYTLSYNCPCSIWSAWVCLMIEKKKKAVSQNQQWGLCRDEW
jgi:hypothetical protein